MSPRIGTPIDLNQLARFSHWPARMLGITPWGIPVRSHEKVREEYEQGNYSRALMAFQNGERDIQRLRAAEFATDASAALISYGEDIYQTTLLEAYQTYYELLAGTILPHVEEGDTLLELGCGYGYNLWMLRDKSNLALEYRGGEYARTGVELGNKLFEGSIEVGQFDFYAPAHPVLEKIKGPIVIFTSHAIEQIPDCGSFLKSILTYKDRIKYVVHIEPGYELQKDSLLGLMRRRYLEINDYNRNLYSVLKGENSIEVIRAEPNVFGINAFNPSSIYEWKFKKQ